MNTEMIFGLVIISLVALIMELIGLFQLNKKGEPVGFYNLEAPPKKENITDIEKWNKKHGMIWILYGASIELGFWFGYIVPSDVLAPILLMGGVVIPIPFMIMRHNSLVKKYWKK